MASVPSPPLPPLCPQPEDEHPGACPPAQRSAVRRLGQEVGGNQRLGGGESVQGAQTCRLQQPGALPHGVPYEGLHTPAELRRYEAGHLDLDLDLVPTGHMVSDVTSCCVVADAAALADPALEERGFPPDILMEDMIPTLKLVIRAVR